MNIQTNLGPVPLIILFGILQGALIVYYFLRTPAFRKANRNYILVFLVLIILSIEPFLNISGYMMYTLWMLNVSTPFIFLVGPLLYLQVMKELGKGKNRLFFLHFLPAILFFGYSFFFYLQPAAFKYDILVRSFHPGATLLPVQLQFFSDPLHIRGYVVVELISLHLIAYSVAGLLRLRKSGPKPFLVLLHICVFAVSLCLLLSEGFIINGKRYLPNPLPPYTTSICAAIFLYCVTFYLLGQTLVTRIKTEKYSKSRIPVAMQGRNTIMIRQVMHEQKPYLDKNFSLDMLAKYTGISNSHLSQTINDALQTSFFELTNQYRIQEAKAILQVDRMTKIEEIGYVVGYNSKSAFYNAFKKQTGISPASFRDKQVS